MDLLEGGMPAPAAPPVPGPDGGARIRQPGRPRTFAGRLLTGCLTAVLLLAVTVGVAAAVRGGGRQAAAVLLRSGSVPYLLAAVTASVAGLLLAVASWRRLLLDVGPPVGVLDGGRIYLVGLLGKFVPGPVWGVVAHVRMGRSLGLPAGAMVTAFFLGLGVTILTGATLGLAVAPTVLGSRVLLLSAPAAALLGCLVWPGAVNRVVATALRLARRPVPVSPASPRAVRASVLLGLASWTVSGLHLWIVASLLGAPVLGCLPVCLGGYALAALAGGFAVVLPDGWGARDAVLLLALSTVLPWPAAGVATVASRLIVMLSEVGGAGVAVALCRARR